MGNKSLADLPELRTISLMQPTNDSIMYFTPCNRSSELNPNEKSRNSLLNNKENNSIILSSISINIYQ